MPADESSASMPAAKAGRKVQPIRVLLVDQDRDVLRLLAQCAVGSPLRLTRASSLAEARRCLAHAHVDLALISAEQPDGSGLALADELLRAGSRTQTIVLSGRATYEGAIAAIRAGAADLLVKPLDPQELGTRLRQACLRQRSHSRDRRKLLRLRRSCRRLNQLRQDVKRQVDMLCRDLVVAYQDLAVQMNRVVQCSEYAAVLREELDLEQLLRKTLEFLLNKAGPANIAIFLPSNQEEYTLSGYVNYDCASDSADVLLEQLAQVLPPLVVARKETLHLDSNQALRAVLDGQLASLDGNHLLAFRCPHDRESLAVVVLFRDGSEPFSADMVELCDSVAPVMSAALARIIRIHHRHVWDDDELDIAGDAA